MRTLGAGLIAAPFVNLIAPRPARAQNRARRLVIFHSPNGTIHRHWRPSGGERDFVLTPGSVLEPLAGRRDDLVFIDGLDIETGTNHEGGMAAMLTNRGGAGTPTAGASLDQFVAGRIGGDDPFASLEFGVLTDLWGAGQQTRMSYRRAGEFVHPDADPRRAYQRMFADLLGGDEVVARRRLRRQSVIDLARDELIDLRGRVGRPEQIKLDAHLAGLRSVERSLFSEGLDCAVPGEPDPLSRSENDNGPQLLETQMRLAVAALACGLTRVASVQFSHTISPVVFRWAGNTDGHHTLSHASDNQEAKIADFVAAERWCAEQFGALIDMLDATPDPEGGSLLDSTIVLWAKEMGDPRAHVCTDVPFVLTGGGVFETGRYLHQGGESHSHLLVSICRALGIDIDTFGDTSTGSGPLAGLS